MYNAQHESLTKEWVDAFTAETGIKVTMRQGSDTELSNQIIQEGQASPADVFLTENSPAMAQVENAGLFADVDKATLEQVPEEFRPSTGKWTGIAARSTVLVYDKNKLSEDQLPKSMLDLAKPEWKGKWAASPTGADFQAIVSALLELKGEDATEEWLQGMKENFKAYKGNSTAMKAVNAGEVDAALIYHYYYYGDQAKTGENSKNVTPYYFKNQDPGAFVSVSGGGVLKTVQERRSGTGVPEVRHRQEGPGSPEGRHLLRVRHRLRRSRQREAGPHHGPAGPHRGSGQAQLRKGHRTDDRGRTPLISVTPGSFGSPTGEHDDGGPGQAAPARLSAFPRCPSWRC